MQRDFWTQALRTTTRIIRATIFLVTFTIMTTTLTTLFVNTTPISHFADAHEAMGGWQYPIECCSNQDCSEYPAENVTAAQGGFLLKEGEFIPLPKARQSPDGHYHICRHPASQGLIQNYKDDLPCFWYPPQGM